MTDLSFAQFAQLSVSYVALTCILLPVFYWLLSALGIFDITGDGHADSGDLFGIHLLTHLGIGIVPLGVLLSLFLFFVGWSSLLLSYIAYNAFGWVSWSVSMGLLVVGVVPAAGLLSLIAKPLSRLFTNYGKTNDAAHLVGKVARVRTSTADKSFGEGVVSLDNGHQITISVRLHDDSVVNYGEEILLIDYIPEKKFYLAEKYA